MPRLLLTSALLLSIINFAFNELIDQVPAIDNEYNISPNGTAMDSFGPSFGRFYNCNFTSCGLPCEGAAAPPTCPDKLPYCVSGCACIRYCYSPTIICFETRHCIHPKKQFIKRKRV